MLVEFTVSMEGPRTDAAPKGVSRRPGHREDLPDVVGIDGKTEAERLIERGMAFAIDADGNALKVTVTHTARNTLNILAEAEAAEREANGGDDPMIQRNQPPERTTAQPPVERAVSRPGKPGAPAAPRGGKKAAG